MRVVRHLLESATQRPSPHADERPPGQQPDSLIIHCISLPPGEFGTGHVEALFTGQLQPDADPCLKELEGLRVSAHLLIERSGHIIQFVPFDRRAWHAGKSRLGERTAVNDFSIGIEVEGLPEVEFESAQYRALADATRAILTAYPQIQPRRIAGHCDIAAGRKVDPGGAFDWQQYFRQAGLLDYA